MADVLTYEEPSTMSIYNGRFEGELSGMNILYYGALQAAALLADAAQAPERATFYARKATRVRTAFNQRFWDEQNGRYKDWRSVEQKSQNGHPINQIAALYFELCDEQQRERLLDGLCEQTGLPDAERSEYPFVTFGFYHYWLEALFKYGRNNFALALLRRYYGSWIAAGATTFGEYYVMSEFHDGKPLAREYEVHAYGTSAHLHFYKHILGVQPVKPGFAEVLIAPKPGDLQSATGSLHTPHGLIKVGWQVQDGAFTLNVQLPQGIEYALQNPPGFGAYHVTINAVKHKIQ